jgi:hypothetical protein
MARVAIIPGMWKHVKLSVLLLVVLLFAVAGCTSDKDRIRESNRAAALPSATPEATTVSKESARPTTPPPTGVPIPTSATTTTGVATSTT